MKDFFGENLILENDISKKIYEEIKNLPIIDYHCHLNQKDIKDNKKIKDIGELWLAGDHYKWRAMRICGVDEKYITGDASYKEKFEKYAEIMPNLMGNPLYYFTHLELKQIFKIDEPLNKESADRIYKIANERLKQIRVLDILKQYKVEYIATTDDPIDDLKDHATYDGIKVVPTFRPDKLYDLSEEYINDLSKATGKKISSLKDLIHVIQERLDYFASKGCKISDHGFERFPKRYATFERAQELYKRKNNLTLEEKEEMFGFLLVFLTKEYAKRNMIMQIHFAVIRNNNEEMFKICGRDSGFDLIGESQDIKDLVKYLNQVHENERPLTILYSLNDTSLAKIACVTGAFRNVRIGASWWFNDTLQGIRRNLEIISEYSVLGCNLGMLTDSRSFSSYSRFDFFRRILANFIGDKVYKGEYRLDDALTLAKNISYYNIKNLL